MQKSVLSLVMVLACCGVGCVRTIQPVLLYPQMQPRDEGLLGAWVVKDGTDSIEVSAGDDPVTYRMLLTDKDNHKTPMLLHIGKIGDLTVGELQPDKEKMELSDVAKAQLMTLYSFVLFQQIKPEPVVTMMKPEWFKSYIEKHPAELTVVMHDGEPIVNATTADFQAFLLKHCKDEGAMTESQTYVRKEKGK